MAQATVCEYSYYPISRDVAAADRIRSVELALQGEIFLQKSRFELVRHHCIFAVSIVAGLNRIHRYSCTDVIHSPYMLLAWVHMPLSSWARLVGTQTRNSDLKVRLVRPAVGAKAEIRRRSRNRKSGVPYTHRSLIAFAFVQGSRRRRTTTTTTQCPST